MNAIAASELIINERGAIHHLNCRPEEIAPLVIAVDDPTRVFEVSKYFDKIYFQNSHLEFVTHTGTIGNTALSVLNTGIGINNIDIAMNELDALVNINFKTRQIKSNPVSLKIVHIGTSGSSQGDIPVGAFVASSHGLGLDNLLHFYQFENNEEEKQILQSFKTHTQIHTSVSAPYINSAGISLLKHFVRGFHIGITATCPGFYGPQGRVLRMGLKNPHLQELLSSFRLGNHRICNFDMGTAAIYGIGNILSHQCLSLSVVTSNRITGELTRNADAAIEKLIKNTLDILTTNV